MDGQGIARLEKEWTDSIFRYVRRLAGLNVCITVLITAEIIAAGYYRALGNATRSPVLRAICGQILIDEAHHLHFQAATLAKERCSWHPFNRWLRIPQTTHFDQAASSMLSGTMETVFLDIMPFLKDRAVSAVPISTK